MERKLEALQEEALEKIALARDLAELEQLQVEFLGKNGKVTGVLRGMGRLDPEERPKVGKKANQVKEIIEKELEARLQALKAAREKQRLQEEAIDITLPGKPLPGGRIHPMQLIIEQLEEMFLRMGFSIEEGPDVETDYYNFEALNIPKNHPARDMQDTFYVEGGLLLRTHTSPVQVRTMEKQAPPIRMITSGKCYRVDELDATHSPVFHQLEGLVIDRGITFSHLKGVLIAVTREIFGEGREVRFRPSYFPFTEPSAEVDVSCFKCQGQGCSLCSRTGWLEILGAGMVNPRVLEMSGIDAERFTGFAFGMGLDRMAMYKYEIEDIRHLWDNDLRFLKQF